MQLEELIHVRSFSQLHEELIKNRNSFCWIYQKWFFSFFPFFPQLQLEELRINSLHFNKIWSILLLNLDIASKYTSHIYKEKLKKKIIFSLQDLTVLPTEFFRRSKTHIPSVINYQRNHRRSISVGESFVGKFFSVGKSVGNKKILLRRIYWRKRHVGNNIFYYRWKFRR
jgi:hypothetical protein